jgi:hypothetical protein
LFAITGIAAACLTIFSSRLDHCFCCSALSVRFSAASIALFASGSLYSPGSLPRKSDVMFCRPSNSGGMTVEADGQSAPHAVHMSGGDWAGLLITS